MKFAVEGWAPEYGAPMDDAELTDPAHPPDLDIEVPVGDWAPRSPGPATVAPESVLFVDGVRRVEARVWVMGDDGTTQQGICASYASGVVRAAVSRASLVHHRVARGLFCPAASAEDIVTRHGTFGVNAVSGDTFDTLSLALQNQMSVLEAKVAAEAETDQGDGELLLVDGPLKQVSGGVGYIKTHHVGYLPDALHPVVAGLAPGQRTPMFLTTAKGGRSRYSWYLRLPGASGHPWAGVIRAEVSAAAPVDQAAACADQVTATLPRFASQAHKDPRAPQNLHPIAGLERELRRRMGDPALLYRALLQAAKTWAPTNTSRTT